MDRRSFLEMTSAAAGASVVGAVAGAPLPAVAATSSRAPAIASGLRELRVASAWSEAVAGPADDARRLLAGLVEASDGRWRFHVIEAEPGATALDLVARGDADLYVASDADHTSLDPAFGYFGGLPGSLGLAPDDHEAWLVAAGGQLLWDDLAAPHGVKPLLAGHLGAPAGLWSPKPLDRLDDLVGADITARGLARDVARGLGGSDHPPGSSNGPEAAIIQGAGLLTDLALGLPSGATHYYTRGIAPAGSTVTLGVSRGLWDSLSRSDRTVLAGTASAAFRESLAAQKLQSRLALDALQQTRSIRVGTLPAGIVRQIDRVSEAVVAHAAASSLRARAIDASLMAYLHASGRNLSVRPVA